MIILVRFFFWSCKAAVLLLVWANFSAIGPLQDPVTWYKNYMYWRASCTVGLPKQCTCLCFGSPTIIGGCGHADLANVGGGGGGGGERKSQNVLLWLCNICSLVTSHFPCN